MAAAESRPVSGLNSLPTVKLSELTRRDSNPLGAKALAINPDAWRHGETEHFIYHFQNSYVATPVSVEAEFHFRVISAELGQTDAAWPEKAHIYIFERPDDWQSFQSAGQLEPWTGGIQSGGSLFIVRNPAYRFTDNSLGHELVHLLLRRIYGNAIPLWLNEGFAQYVSKKAHSSYLRARGYTAKPSSNGVPADKLVPLATFTRMGYPPTDQVEAFYDQSERLVRFLVAVDRSKFLELLSAAARGESFEAAVTRASFNTFGDVSALEESFRRYAVKDADTSSPAP